jgi:predicted histone-like DNA-binding protein
MSLKYRPVRKLNPAKRDEPPLYFPNPVFTGRVTTRTVAKAIADRTSLSTTDTIAVLDACSDVIPEFLLRGATVSLNNLGTFRLSMKGKGAPTAKQLTSSHVTDIRIHFHPAPDFAGKVKDATLEKERKPAREKIGRSAKSDARYAIE